MGAEIMGDHFQAALADRYRIATEIGSGGTATVYAADDLRNRRPVAVKVFRPAVAQAIGVERFLTEIEVTANLLHPHILPLFDSGEVAGIPYYVMPLVEGESLRGPLSRGGLPAAEAVDIAAGVAEALDYAHSRGIIHRDIKPENILLMRGHPLVCDFGIGKVLTAGKPTTLPTSGFLGTPSYMSPEQLAEETTLTGRSDLFSLGCVLFEMLTGQPLYPGGSPFAVLARRVAQANEPIEPRLATIPRGIAQVLARLLQQNPSDRYATGREVVAALRAAMGQVSEPERPGIAVLPFASLSAAADDEFFADGITEEIINALAQISQLKVTSRTSSFYYKSNLPDLATVGRQLGVGWVLEGSVRRNGQRARITTQLIDVARNAHLWSETYDRDLDDVFGVQDEIAAAVASKLKVILADQLQPRPLRATKNPDAYELFLKGRALQYRRGPALWQAMECFERAIGLDPNYSDAHAWLGDSYRLLGIYGGLSADSAIAKARAEARHALAIDPNHAEAHATLADIAVAYDHDAEAARSHWERALQAEPGHVRARCERAVRLLCLREGQMDAAIEVTCGVCDGDPMSAYAAGIHAMVLGIAGWFDQALIEADRSRELDPAGFLGQWLGVEIAVWAGDGQRALAAAQEAVTVTGRHPWVLGSLAHAFRLAGRDLQSRSVFGEVERRAEHEFIQPYALARAALGAGLIDVAIGHIAAAVEAKDPMIMAMARFPGWEPVRGHPKYPELALRLGFLGETIASTSGGCPRNRKSTASARTT